jgi:peptidoglycan/xylan/chitin deacetylase (PgdA/CDA1 family)
MTNQLKIPVLMYHALVKKRTASLHTVHIEQTLFQQQVEWLAGEGFQSITIDAMLRLFTDRNADGKYCVITFDDGYHSLYNYALPLLKDYGFSATLFLSTAAVGHNDFSTLTGLNTSTLPVDDKPLTWKEIKEMHQNGWSIQSHSISHADNSLLNKTQMLHEITGSKKIIEQKLHHPVLHYAFPFGKYNAESLQLLKEAGYESSFTVHAGLCSSKNNMYRLPRLEINHRDDLASFKKKVTSGFSTNKEKIRSSVRNAVFSNPKVKDISKKILGKKIN